MSGDDEFGNFETMSVPVAGGIGDFGDFAWSPTSAATAVTSDPFGSFAAEPGAGTSSLEFAESLVTSADVTFSVTSENTDELGGPAAPHTVTFDCEPDDAFGSFGDAPAAAVVAPTDETDDAFGSFSDTPVAAVAATADEANDAFGSLSDAPVAAATADEADDAFGSFGEAFVAAASSDSLEPTPPDAAISEPLSLAPRARTSVAMTYLEGSHLQRQWKRLQLKTLICTKISHPSQV